MKQVLKTVEVKGEIVLGTLTSRKHVIFSFLLFQNDTFLKTWLKTNKLDFKTNELL